MHGLTNKEITHWEELTRRASEFQREIMIRKLTIDDDVLDTITDDTLELIA